MPETYKSGGILEVLHLSNTEESKNQDKESEKEHVLANLFTKDEEEEEEDEVKFATDIQIAEIKSIVENIERKEVKKKKIKTQETPERLERTLFVGNVALTVTKKMLKKIFMKFGEIENLRFRSFVGAEAKLPKKVAIINKTFHSECKSMNAYIVYKSKDSIGKPLSCNGMLLEGLHIRVDKASPEKQHNNKQCLFVGNLPFNVTEDALYKHFEQCGEIESVRVIRDKFSGMGKGFGYVTFKSHDGVVFGIKLNGSKLDGRDIRVYRSENKKDKKQSSNDFGGRDFCGLKSTKGKRHVQEKKRTSTNAMRRIKGKGWTNGSEAEIFPKKLKKQQNSKDKKKKQNSKDKQKGFRNKR